MADEYWTDENVVDHVQKLAPDVPRKTIETHLQAYKDIAKRMAEQDDNFSIALTHVGKIYIKTDKIRSTAKRDIKDAKLKEFYQKKLEKIQSTDKSGVNFLHNKRFWLRNFYERKKFTWEDLENIQNEVNGENT